MKSEDNLQLIKDNLLKIKSKVNEVIEQITKIQIDGLSHSVKKTIKRYTENCPKCGSKGVKIGMNSEGDVYFCSKCNKSPKEVDGDLK